MKRLFLLLLSLTLITVSLGSCSAFDSGYPTISENFGSGFSLSKDYRYDSQLYYYSAAAPEVEKSNPFFTNETYLRLGIIKDTDPNMFIAGVSVNYNNQGGLMPIKHKMSDYDSRANAIASKYAPVPMRDWTVRSIRLVSLTNTDGAGLTDLLKNESMSDFDKFAQSPVSSSAVQVAEFTDEATLQSIKLSYATPIIEEDYRMHGVYMDRSLKYEEDNSTTHFYLIVDFVENENIFWCSHVFSKDGTMYVYIGRETIGEEKPVPQGKYLFCELDKSFAQQLSLYLKKPYLIAGLTSNNRNAFHQYLN